MHAGEGTLSGPKDAPAVITPRQTISCLTRGLDISTVIYDLHPCGRRDDRRHGSRDPSGLHASASLAGNGRSEDGSNSRLHTVDAATRRYAICNGRLRFPNSHPSRHSLDQASEGAIHNAVAAACGRYKRQFERMPER